jgi:CSLREA domain-containing protein
MPSALETPRRRWSRPIGSFVAAAALVLGAPSAQATLYNVSVTADDANLGANGNCTLREAVLAANTNTAVDACLAGSVGQDTILLAAGSYSLTIPGRNEDQSATGDLDVREALTISGVSAASTTIDGSALGDRLLQVATGVTARVSDLTMSGARLTGGNAEAVAGGGVWNDGDLTLNRVRVTDNRATGGNSANASANGGSGTAAGILNSSTGSLVLDTVEVSANVSTGGNGGLTCCSMSCSCMQGSSGGGASAGGILNQGVISIRTSTIQDNSANGGNGTYFASAGAASAGGLLTVGATASILDTLFARNHASAGSGLTTNSAFGGALYVGGGAATLEQSLVAENTVQASTTNLVNNGSPAGGAGAFVATGATLDVRNSTMAKNVATASPAPTIGSYVGGAASGGAIDSDGTVVVESSTLADNQVTAGAAGTGTAGAVLGGAINSDGATSMVNTAIAANLGVVPGGPTTDEACDGTVAITSIGGNLESPSNSCALAGSGDLAFVTAGSLALQPLANNGGATWTQALGAGSPAINTGVSGSCPSVDQRHYARIGVCDRGAYEVGGTPCTDADHDGYSVEGGACGAVDCSDSNAAVNPGAVEIPGNGIDDDCNAGTPGCLTPQAADASVGAGTSGTTGLGGTLGAALFLFVGIRSMRRRS